MRKLLAWLINRLTLLVAFFLRPILGESRLEEYKPIHLCWWFRKHNFDIPKYFIAGHTFFDPYTTAYRFYQDGTLASSTALAAQGTNLTPTVTADYVMQIRIRIQEQGGLGEANVYRLDYTRNGGAQTQIDGASSFVRSYNGTPADGADVTAARLTGGSGSFVTGKYDEGDGVTPSMTLTANNFTEHVWSVVIRYADVGDGDVLTFPVLIDGKTMTNNVTPTVTITKLQAPTVTTQAATSVAATSATGNGNITNRGNENASVRGFVVSTSANPTTASNDFIFNTSGSYGTGAFSQSMTGLSPSTLYHYRAYATNSIGTSYGADTEFTTPAVDAVRNPVQYQSDRETPLATGGSVLVGSDPMLQFDVTVGSDTETTDVIPSVEVDPVGTAFTNTASNTLNTLHWNPDIWKGVRGSGIWYDATNQRFVMTHGAYNTTYRAEAWELDMKQELPKWRKMAPRDSSGTLVTAYNGTQAPEGRYYFGQGWDSGNNHAIFFGGYSGTDNNDLWRWWFTSGSDGEWWELSPTGGPPAARSNIGEMMTYDTGTNKSWVFGGWGSVYYNDVWELDMSSFNGAWTQRHTGSGTAPPVTRNGSLIYDSTNNRLIQFGGHNGTTSRNTVWSFNLSTYVWTELTGLGTAPAARELHVAKYDAVNNRMLMWGGNSNSSSGTYYRDMWELDLTSGSEAWNNISDVAEHMPLGTYGSFSAVDTTRNMWYIGGGVDSTADPERREFVIDMNDTGDPIKFYGLNWNNKYRPLDAPAFAFNPDANEFVMTHGYQHIPDNGVTIADGGHGTATHIYDVANNIWRNGVVGYLAPFQREGSSLVYDTNRNRFIFYGGGQGNIVTMNDVWSLTRNTNGDYYWTKLNPTGTKPPTSWLHVAGYDATNDRMVIWGGSAGTGGPNRTQVWELSFSGSADGVWTQRTPTGTALTAAWGSAYAVDTKNNYLWIVGGATGTGDSGYSAQSGYLDMSTTNMVWNIGNNITTGRRSAVLSYNPYLNHLILWGGYNGAVLNDSQILTPGIGNWNSVSQTSAPSARRSHAGFHANNKFYITAGRPSTGTWFNDTQSIEISTTFAALGTWVNENPIIQQLARVALSSLTADNYHWQSWAGSSSKVSYPAPTKIEKFYFDGSDVAVSDPDNVWTNETNLTDGNLTTTADTTTVGTNSTNELKIEGTNAPATGGTISSVKARFNRQSGGDSTLNVDIYDDGKTTQLYSENFNSDVGNGGVSAPVELTVPSGGWTWAKIQSLEAYVFVSDYFTGAMNISIVELIVESDVSNLESATDFTIGAGVTTDSQTKNLSYEIVTTPTAKTKSLEYQVTAPATPITKTIDYSINIGDVITKPLEYSVVTTATPVTKSLEYRVVTTATPVTKSLEYQVVKPSSSTKSLQYTVVVPVPDTKSLTYEILDTNAIQKDLAYSVTTTATPLTKSLEYYINQKFPITKGLVYTVKAQDSQTKSLQYAVVAPATPVTKSLDYVVQQIGSVTKTLAYTVVTTPTVITKSLEYRIVQTEPTTKSLEYQIVDTKSATKSLEYRIVDTTDVTKSLMYVVVAPNAPITKALEYAVVAPATPITKSLEYRVDISPTATTKSLEYAIRDTNSITKSMRYDILGTQTYSVTKSLEYRVAVATPVTKSLAYEVKDTNAITKALEYQVITQDSTTKQLTYRVLLGDSQTKSLDYQIVVKTPDTRSLQYTVIDNNFVQLDMQYYVTPSGSIGKAIKYTVTAPATPVSKSLLYKVAPSLSFSKSLSYAVKTPQTQTKTAKYTVVAQAPAINRTLTYHVTTGDFIEKGVQYTVITNDSAQKSLEYRIALGDVQLKTLEYAVKPTFTPTKSLKYTVLTNSLVQKDLNYIIQNLLSVTKSLQYTVTSNDLVQKALLYGIVTSDFTTKSLTYMVASPKSRTKSVTYRVLTNDMVQKPIEYRVTPSTTLQQSTKYTVIAPKLIQQSLQYSIVPSGAVSKSAQYTVIQTPTAKSKNLTYSVITGDVILKSVTYAVVPSIQVQRTLTYAVRTQSNLQKSIDYQIQNLESITKSLKYVITSTPAVLNKSLEYSVITADRNTKSLSYAVKPTVTVQKSAKYTVITSTDSQKSLQYSIVPEANIYKPVQYTVTSTPASIQLGLEYRIDLGATAPQKGLEYAIRATKIVQKSAQYAVITSKLVQKALQYNLLPIGVLAKAVQYAILKTYSTTKQLAYRVVTGDSQSKSLEYRVNGSNVQNQSLQYTVKAQASETRQLIYVVFNNSAISKGLVYQIQSQGLETKSLTYEVKKTQQITKSLTYIVQLPTLVRLDLSYAIKSTNTVQLSMRYDVEPRGRLMHMGRSSRHTGRSGKIKAGEASSRTRR